MLKMTRKGKNPGAVDSWLDSLGLYRKNVAYDETCLFRSVSEQLFDCQIHHERVRKECIVYAREKYEDLKYLIDDEEKWHEYLDRLEKHMVVCGNIELHIISKKYERNIVIFDAAQQSFYDITNVNFSKSLLLCLLDKDHFDVVYKKDHIANAGFCQSIVYKILYENVFDISNVDDIVNIMLYDKGPMTTQTDQPIANKVLESNNDLGMKLEEGIDEKQSTTSFNIAPFPFKVAKALDPSIYRNIEYDSWGEVRREMRLGDWYYGDDNLILGTKCVYNDKEKDEQHECYIQEIIKDENRCIIYLMKLAQKKTVSYSDLSPENDAKPWPLPYRFSKNVNISVPTLPPEFKFTQKPKKRVKDKKRTKSESSAISNTVSGSNADHLDHVNAFVGVPLQMQNINEGSSPNRVEATSETNTDITVPKETIVMPETPSTPGKYSYEPATTQWYSYLPPTPDSFVWSHTATSPGVFNFKPMVASAPVTPDVVPYHDTSYPFYYNYHMESAAYQNYNQWNTAGADYQQAVEKHEDIKCQTVYVDVSHTENAAYSESTVQYQTDYPQPQQQQNYEKNDTAYESGNNITSSRPKERPTLITNLTPPSPAVEVYSPIIPVPPGTPVIYAPPPPPPEMTEMVIPNTPILYTPTLDVQYVSPGPYIYPPTPPATWYPAGITSQGFIFPTGRN